MKLQCSEAIEKETGRTNIMQSSQAELMANHAATIATQLTDAADVKAALITALFCTRNEESYTAFMFLRVPTYESRNVKFGGT